MMSDGEKGPTCLRRSCKLSGVAKQPRAIVACFAFMLLFTVVVADAQPAYVCKQSEQLEVVYINSTNAHCTPALLTAHVHTIHIDRVQSFDFVALKGLSRLRTLVCRACGLRNLALLEYATSSLQTLNVSHNRITSTNGTTFRRFKHLRNVNLLANSIRTVDTRCFRATNAQLNLNLNSLRAIIRCTKSFPNVTVVTDTKPNTILDATSECCASPAVVSTTTAAPTKRRRAQQFTDSLVIHDSSVGDDDEIDMEHEDDEEEMIVQGDIAVDSQQEASGQPVVAIVFEIIGALVSAVLTTVGGYYLRKYILRRRYQQQQNTANSAATFALSSTQAQGGQPISTTQMVELSPVAGV
jgi:hypothetical protein